MKDAFGVERISKGAPIKGQLALFPLKGMTRAKRISSFEYGHSGSYNTWRNRQAKQIPGQTYLNSQKANGGREFKIVSLKPPKTNDDIALSPEGQQKLANKLKELDRKHAGRFASSGPKVSRNDPSDSSGSHDRAVGTRKSVSVIRLSGRERVGKSDAFGAEISKSSVGAGRYVRAIDMPAKIRARQIARLKAGKPQVAPIQDQIFNSTRANPELINFSSVMPKTKGTVIQTGRKKRTAQLHNVGENNIGTYAAVTVPNPRKNTNHILMPDKSKTKGVHGFLLEHEKTHAQLKPKRLAQAQFRTSRQRLGEEARADATATLKTGRKRNPSSYTLAGNKNYEKVYTKIVGRKPKYGMSGRDLKQIDPPSSDFVGSKNEIRRIYRSSARVMNRPSYKARTGPVLQEAFTRRAPGPHWLDGSTPHRYNRKPNLP